MCDEFVTGIIGVSGTLAGVGLAAIIQNQFEKRKEKRETKRILSLSNANINGYVYELYSIIQTGLNNCLEYSYKKKKLAYINDDDQYNEENSEEIQESILSLASSINDIQIKKKAILKEMIKCVSEFQSYASKKHKLLSFIEALHGFSINRFEYLNDLPYAEFKKISLIQLKEKNREIFKQEFAEKIINPLLQALQDCLTEL